MDTQGFHRGGVRILPGRLVPFHKSDSPPAGGGGPGAGRGNGRYSSTFGAEVFKEMVDGHTFSVSAGIDWTRSWFSTVNYTYRTWDGDLGSADDSSGYAGIAYRFGISDR